MPSVLSLVVQTLQIWTGSRSGIIFWNKDLLQSIRHLYTWLILSLSSASCVPGAILGGVTNNRTDKRRSSYVWSASYPPSNSRAQGGRSSQGESLSPEPVPAAWECRVPIGQPEGGVNPKKSFRPRVWDMRFTKVWKDRTNCVSCGDWRVTPVSGGSEGGLEQLCQTGFPLVAAQVS